ncbi:MAG: hypothetical protein ACI8PZ_006861 [Myxococcota bacterium]|jgi:hypothetical protein
MLLPLLLAASAQAVPVQLAHQGRLLTVDGVPLTGPHTLELALYDDPVGGDVLWAEAQDAEFIDSTFALLLGADALNPIDDEVLAERSGVFRRRDRGV